jgi:hypothetical protein
LSSHCGNCFGLGHSEKNCGSKPRKKELVSKKYMDDYNYHDWSSFMVQKPEQKPKGPHFAGIMFDSHREYSGYDNDPGYDVAHVVYFAFPDKETLAAWVLRASKDKKQIFFFEVKKVGTSELKVNIDLEV